MEEKRFVLVLPQGGKHIRLPGKTVAIYLWPAPAEQPARVQAG